jgi:tRNA threonylcarbamoyladenosine biosynthesis protein TsaB
MLILAFNTTDDHGGAAIYRDTKCLGVVAANGSSASYSITLFQMVDTLLRPTQLSLRDIELFAVAHGPGSFTGIRIGVAAAQAWGTAFSRPVCGISVLEAMVEEARPDTQVALSILDARRGEFFLSLFERAESTGALLQRGEALLAKPDRAAHLVEQAACTVQPAHTLTCVVRQHDVAAQLLASNWPQFSCRSLPGPLVEGIARCALRAYQQGMLQSPAELDAYYVRRTDAELKWRE